MQRAHAEAPRYTGFAGQTKVASGDLISVALKLKAVVDRGEKAAITLIDDDTGDSVSLNLHGTREQLQARLERKLAQTAQQPEPEARRGPGRPKLGVVSREVSLLPRHWEWLASQPGGASAVLRRLVEQARRDNEGRDRARRARDAAYRFMHVMAGDLPGFEEVSRALFAGDSDRARHLMRPWPKDIREHARKMAEKASKLADQAE